ncbi:MAG: ShlB/FhaC/HecB family hemolysin secretion/activation protein, partial [Sphingomonadales bacterium]
ACGSSAAAQTLPQTLSPPTREQVEQKAPAQVQLPRARLEVEGGVERAPCALDRPEYQNIRFTPTEVMFDDLQGLDPEALRPAYAPFLGREQPVSVVCEIRDRAATILRDAGYVASVEVPEQRIAEGRLRFQVLMAKLVAVSVRGDAGKTERLIASYLERLKQEPVFNRFRAERYLLLAGDLPGYSVRLSLKSAGQARGEVIGEVTILRVPFVADANLQNWGSNSIGRWGAMVRGQLFGLTGMGDRTTVSAFSTLDFDEQQTLQLAHEFRLGGEGLTFAGQFTYAWTHPDLGDPNLNVRGRTLFATLEADYPLVRRQSETVRGALGVDIVNQSTRFNGLPLTRDHLRVAFARLEAQLLDTDFSNRRYSLVEPRWRLGGSIELRQGLDILNASPDCRGNPLGCVTGGRVPPSRLDGDPTATVLRGSAAAEFRPLPRFTLAVAARGQHSSDPLLSFEEFSAGNYTVGRGYDPGAIIGDRGVGLQGEARFGTTVPGGPDSFVAEPFVFVDQAWVWNKGPLAGAMRSAELTSVGGGVRAAYGDQFRLELTFAEPLDRVPLAHHRKDPRLLFSLTTRLWPWSLR